MNLQRPFFAFLNLYQRQKFLSAGDQNFDLAYAPTQVDDRQPQNHKLGAKKVS